MGEIDNNLRLRREELGLSQQDVAVLLGVTRVTYSKWESDIGTMPIGRYEQLAQELDRLEQLREHEV